MAENEVPKKTGEVSGEQTPGQVTSVKKAAPSEELADTVEQFFTSVQSAGMRSLKSMLAQFVEKADAALTKLDVGTPPKKQD